MTGPPTTPVDDDTRDVVQAAGRFRIYLGAAAGVGKTFAMLNEGRRRAERGTDIVIGFVETHGRAHTIEMCQGLEEVPRLKVEYRGSVFEEMDLDAVLARRPAVALVDELAHTNVPGSGRHEKRWEDVLEIIEAGISVITTVNIQHLESLADAVERITGVAISERVPDWVVQVRRPDSSSSTPHRNNYGAGCCTATSIPPTRSHRRSTRFFRTENLMALRELALRFLADEAEEDLLEYLRLHDITGIWETTERILVCVTAAPGSDSLLRRAARLAARLKSELHVVHVTGEASVSSDRPTIDGLRQLSKDLGAEWDSLAADDPAAAIVEYAKKHQITQIVLGSSRRSRWQEISKGEIVRKVLRYASDAGIDVHVIARREAFVAAGNDGSADGG